MSSCYQYELSPGGLDGVRLKNDRVDDFRKEQDSVIDIAGSMPLRVDDAETRVLGAEETEQHGPELLMRDGESYDLSRSFASKIFVRSPQNRSASVLLKDGEERRWSLKVEMER